MNPIDSRANANDLRKKSVSSNVAENGEHLDRPSIVDPPITLPGDLAIPVSISHCNICLVRLAPCLLGLCPETVLLRTFGIYIYGGFLVSPHHSINWTGAPHLANNSLWRKRAPRGEARTHTSRQPVDVRGMPSNRRFGIMLPRARWNGSPENRRASSGIRITAVYHSCALAMEKEIEQRMQRSLSEILVDM